MHLLKMNLTSTSAVDSSVGLCCKGGWSIPCLRFQMPNSGGILELQRSSRGVVPDAAACSHACDRKRESVGHQEWQREGRC
jgi:hypothetical protein